MRRRTSGPRASQEGTDGEGDQGAEGLAESKAHEVKRKAQSVKEAEEQGRLWNRCCTISERRARARKEHNKLDERVGKLERDLQEQTRSNVALVAENKKAANELKMRVDEANAARAEAGRVVQVKESTLNKLRAAEKEKTDVEKSRDDLKRVIGELETEIEKCSVSTSRRSARSRMSSSASETCS